MTLRLALLVDTAADPTFAAELQDCLALPRLPPHTDARSCVAFDALLCVTGRRVSLQQTGPRAPGPVEVDFGAAAMRHRRRGGQNELLGRAVGIGRRDALRVIDATAGLGRDAFVLADLGCSVRLCEREPVIGALLAAGLERARTDADPWLAACARRMALHRGDARALPAAALNDVDVIYLDPMFPPRGKRAAVKKEMALFQRLLEAGPREDNEALVAWALTQAVARVVIKRPLRAPPLGGRAASHSVKGKAVRYDVHVLRGLSPDPSVAPGSGTGGG